MIRCKNCGCENQLGSEFCFNCSSQLITDVFISYSRKDYVDSEGRIIKNNIISRIKSSLSAAGISYWFDEDGIYSGDEFASVITRAIRNSTVFLFVSSVNSNASRWTSNEISAAMAFKKPIIPFRIDDSPYNDSVMMKIISFDYIECKERSKAMEQLVRAVRHWVPEESQRVPKEVVDSSSSDVASNESIHVSQASGVSAMSILSLELSEIKRAFAKRRMIINILEVVMLATFTVSGFVSLFLSFIEIQDIEFYTVQTALSYIGLVGTYRLMKNCKDCLYWLIPLSPFGVAILIKTLSNSVGFISAIVLVLLIVVLLTCVKKEGKSVWNLLQKATRPIKDDFIYLLMIFVLIVGCLGLVPIYLAL